MSGRVILFDVMDTLVVDPFRDVMPAYFGLTFEAMMHAKDPHAWVDFERSLIDEATFFERFFADRRAFDGDGLREAVREAYVFVPGMEALLEDLRRAGAPMHALSNYPCWYELIETKLGLRRYLAARFVSFETGLRKPDPEAYAASARTLGVPTSACIFVDDRASNCAAAEDVGMDAIVFQGAASLREALARRGFTVA